MNQYKLNIEEIKKMLISFEKIDYAFLFGSAVKTLRPESDIDILVGGEINISQGIDLARRLELILKKNVDVVLSDLASPAVVLKAFSKGISLCINDKKKLKKDYFKNLYQYEDEQNLKNLKMIRLKRRFNNG